MTFVVTENCIKCKYADCVEVCPVDCFYDGGNMLVIRRRGFLMSLNKLQQKVLLLYSEGLSYTDISRKIRLSELTVSLILNSALDRLEVNNTAQASIIYSSQSEIWKLDR